MEAKWNNKEKDPYNFEAETSKKNNLKSKMMFSSSSLHAKHGQPNRKAAYGKSLLPKNCRVFQRIAQWTFFQVFVSSRNI